MGGILHSRPQKAKFPTSGNHFSNHWKRRLRTDLAAALADYGVSPGFLVPIQNDALANQTIVATSIHHLH
jgi:hypothetical protein